MHDFVPQEAKMTDRLMQVTPPPAPARTPLAAHGRLWAVLLDDGRYLEVRRADVLVVFDLEESIRQRRGVIAWLEDDGG
jgi:hypothetical protein